MAIHREPWPEDLSRATTRLALVVSQIRISDDADRDDLLVTFLRAGWPSLISQRQ